MAETTVSASSTHQRSDMRGLGPQCGPPDFAELVIGPDTSGRPVGSSGLRLPCAPPAADGFRLARFVLALLHSNSRKSAHGCLDRKLPARLDYSQRLLFGSHSHAGGHGERERRRSNVNGSKPSAKTASSTGCDKVTVRRAHEVLQRLWRRLCSNSRLRCLRQDWRLRDDGRYGPLISSREAASSANPCCAHCRDRPRPHWSR